MYYIKMPRYLVEDFNTSCTVVDFLHACMGVSITPSCLLFNSIEILLKEMFEIYIKL